MSTKISGGVFRGRIIESPEGDSTRPTSNKIRQAMFSTLGQNMAGVTFYDVFAGSGSVGIEALSRGAEHAIFIEDNPAAISKIKFNLNQLGLMSQSTILKSDALHYLDNLLPMPNSIVFIDPPFVPNFPDLTNVIDKLLRVSDLVVQFPKGLDSKLVSYFPKVKCYGVSCLGYHFKDEIS